MSKALFLGTTGEFEATKVELTGDGEGIGDGTGSFESVAPVDLYGNALGQGIGTGTFSPPATGDWPDPFMSYTPSTPLVLTGESGTTIDYLSFDRTARRDLGNPRPITLIGCDNITIRRIDTRGCTMGILYAYQSTNINMEFIRCENINEEYDRFGWTLPPGDPDRYFNDNDMNFYQLNECNVFTFNDLKGRYGNTEDVISMFNSSNGTVDRVAWEGATLGNEPTSDGAPAMRWRSASGTGGLIGDGGAAVNVRVRDSSFLNPGQVGIAIAGGVDMRWEDSVSLSERASTVSEYDEKPSGENIASYIAEFYTGCGDAYMTNNRTRFSNGDNYWFGGGCNPILSGNVFGDGSLNVEDYRVTL
jgi:hypothetical protein